jgi:catechol 2,3-dioxygenase-like lactoylglutathione lyase family enzyme
MMFDHIGLKVKDLDAAVRFYVAALEPLGHVLGPIDKTYAGIGPKDAPGIWLYAAGKSDGRENGAPGLRKDYSPTYYAAFLLDPDGNNVEAVCLK